MRFGNTRCTLGVRTVSQILFQYADSLTEVVLPSGTKDMLPHGKGGLNELVGLAVFTMTPQHESDPKSEHVSDFLMSGAFASAIATQAGSGDVLGVLLSP